MGTAKECYNRGMRQLRDNDPNAAVYAFYEAACLGEKHALDKLEELVKKHNISEANYWLGLYHSRQYVELKKEENRKRLDSEGLVLLHRSANLAIKKLSSALHSGIEEALPLLKKIASDTRFPEASYRLGVYYSSKPRDRNASTLSEEYFERAGNAGHADSAYCYALEMRDDSSKKRKWLRKAAGLGDIDAMIDIDYDNWRSIAVQYGYRHERANENDPLQDIHGVNRLALLVSGRDIATLVGKGAKTSVNEHGREVRAAMAQVIRGAHDLRKDIASMKKSLESCAVGSQQRQLLQADIEATQESLDKDDQLLDETKIVSDLKVVKGRNVSVFEDVVDKFFKHVKENYPNKFPRMMEKLKFEYCMPGAEDKHLQKRVVQGPKKKALVKDFVAALGKCNQASFKPLDIFQQLNVKEEQSVKQKTRQEASERESANEQLAVIRKQMKENRKNQNFAKGQFKRLKKQGAEGELVESWINRSIGAAVHHNALKRDLQDMKRRLVTTEFIIGPTLPTEHETFLEPKNIVVPSSLKDKVSAEDASRIGKEALALMRNPVRLIAALRPLDEAIGERLKANGVSFSEKDRPKRIIANKLFFVPGAPPKGYQPRKKGHLINEVLLELENMHGVNESGSPIFHGGVSEKAANECIGDGNLFSESAKIDKALLHGKVIHRIGFQALMGTLNLQLSNGEKLEGDELLDLLVNSSLLDEGYGNLWDAVMDTNTDSMNLYQLFNPEGFNTITDPEDAFNPRYFSTSARSPYVFNSLLLCFGEQLGLGHLGYAMRDSHWKEAAQITAERLEEAGQPVTEAALHKGYYRTIKEISSGNGLYLKEVSYSAPDHYTSFSLYSDDDNIYSKTPLADKGKGSYVNFVAYVEEKERRMEAFLENSGPIARL